MFWTRVSKALPLLSPHPHFLDIIAVHSGAGGRTQDSRLGPEALKEAGIVDWLKALGLTVDWHDIGPSTRRASPEESAIGHVADVCARVSLRIHQSVSEGRRFLVLGGDHSCAIGTWSGAFNALGGRGAMGLLWVDAHMDSHVPETSPSGNVHGMPVAHLLGHGAVELTALAKPGPAVRPGDIAIVGARSFEPEEPEFLDLHGVRVYHMDHVTARGTEAVIGEALEGITAETAAFGISIDLDALDPADAPGTGSAVENGIRATELAAAHGGMGRSDARFLGLEIAEFNPILDKDGQTVETVKLLVESFFADTGGD